MRIKIIFPILLIALAVIALALRSKHSAPAPAPVAAVAPANSSAVPPAMVMTKPIFSNAPPAKPILTVRPHIDTNGMSAHDISIHEEIQKLSQLQANDDAESLHEILSDLTNSDKTIRAAALESTIQFASRDAVPYLRNLASSTSDPQERTNLIEAADYLELPSWTEIHQQDPNARLGKASPLANDPAPEQ
ncbi:MAG TPA: hypothetical protein VFV23_05960 [Verrucomicrobiae bacterium]|nr:hypothetical protein [Verrucomicrobiae bacterium]